MPSPKPIVRKAALPVRIPNFSCFETVDGFGRTVTFYLSDISGQRRLPIAAFVQGSGCHSVFRLGGDGRIRVGYQNILQYVSGQRVRVLAVEKPGVRFLDDPKQPGVAHGCSQTFLEEHTLDRWAEAVNACLSAARTLANTSRRKLLIIGHSEGGQIAARVAATNPKVSHVALLSSTGPTQLYDFVARAGSQSKKKRTTANYSRSLNEVREIFEAIQSDPDSTSKFAWGHPYRRWSSFLSSSTIDEILRTRARIFMAHGVRDRSVPIAAFDMLVAALIRERRDIVVQRIEGAAHSFSKSRRASPRIMTEIFSDILEWFLNEQRAS
jgi:pimeloyl-ACP methyl ester carboxylesterase